MRPMEAQTPKTACRRWLCLLPLLAVMLFAGCDADSPTEPKQPATSVPAPAPTNLTLQMSAEPTSIELGDTAVEVLIRALATLAGTGQPAPDNATIILSTTLGMFPSTATDGTETLDRSVVVRTTRGQATAMLRFQPGELGSAVIQGQLNSSFSQTVVDVRPLVPPAGPPPPAPFFVAEVVPNTGAPSGGYTAQIIGSGFDPPFRVLFGAIPAQVRSSSDTTLSVDVPPINLAVGQVQTVDVSVTINRNDTDPDAQQQTDSLPSAFSYARSDGGGTPLAPQIISLSPSSGPNEGGTEVTIRGENFGTEVQVFLSGGSLVEAEVLSVTANRILIRTPAATGSNFANQNSVVDLRVRNLGSGIEAVLPGAFQYGDGNDGAGVILTSAGPTRGFYTGGTVVNIFGSGYDEPVAVEFGGFAQQVLSVTGTEIIARSVKVPLTGCASTSGPFGVVNVETGEGVTSTLQFIYDPILVSISGITPSSVTTDEFGNVTGATIFVISGVVGFDVGDPVTVTFGDVFAFGAVFDPVAGTITGQIPPFTGIFQTITCGPGDAGMTPGPARVDVKIRNEFTGCQIDLTNRFTYTPVAPCVLPPPPPPPGTAPSASFTVSPAGDVPLGATVFFTDTSTGTPTGWQWTFGDGGTSTMQNPSHTYAATGAFTVTLIASNANGSSSASTTVTVVP